MGVILWGVSFLYVNPVSYCREDRNSLGTVWCGPGVPGWCGGLGEKIPRLPDYTIFPLFSLTLDNMNALESSFIFVIGNVIVSFSEK